MLLDKQQLKTSNKQSSSESVISGEVNIATSKLIYQKPMTSVFLKSNDIKGGTINVPESDDGILAS